MPQDKSPPPAPAVQTADPIAFIRDALNRLKFGAINLTVHEGKLVQVDVTERNRFTS